MVPEKATSPDTAQIEAHLRHMTRRWHELGQPVMMEIVHLTPDDKARVRDVARFSPDATGIALAIDHVAAMNAHGVNSYVTVNPVDAKRQLRAGHRADTDDIVGSFFHFADGDTQQAADNIRNFVGPKCTFVVVTGTTPHVRPHVYWELEEPTRNMSAWSRIQASIAATLATDKVIDAPRIMRIAGTINWPKPAKQAKGYVAELTTIHIHDADERPPVTSEQMDRAFQGRHSQAAAGVKIDTGEEYGPALDRALAIANIKSDNNWRNNIKALVASYVARGWTDDEILDRCVAFTLPGYTDADTRQEVEALISWTREQEAKKGGKYATSPTVQMQAYSARTSGSTAEDSDHQPFDTTPLSPADLVGIRPRRWLYGHKLVRGFVSVLASPGGTGKSAWVTAAALDMATGTETLHDKPHGALRVWIYNLEDPRDETLRKVDACMRHKKIPNAALGNIIVTSGRDRSLIVAEEVERGLIVAHPDVKAMVEAIKSAKIDVLTVDPVVRSHRVTENDNKAVDFVMDLYAKIADEADCAIMLVHHTRKGFVSGDADSIRGGSAMTSAARVAITMTAMQSEEAQRLNIPESARTSYVRVDSAKANLAPPSGSAEWLKLESQWLDNATEEYPEGDYVQVATKWKPPLPWEGIGGKIMEIFDRIDRGHVSEDGTATPYGHHKNSGDRWVVNAVLASFPDGDFSEVQAIGCITKWTSDGFLEVREFKGRDRKSAKGVFVKNRPTNEAENAE